MPTLLGIESTCDETAAAVVRDGREVLSSVVASQVELHAKYRGVVPEIASRAHIENILPVLRESVQQSGVSLEQVDAIAVTHRPGLIGSLLVGLTAAKTLAWALGKPLVGVDHVHAHLYSVMLDEPIQNPKSKIQDPSFPALGLVISGGHTALYRLGSWTDVELIGTTRDDAVGEAYDKVAAILGLGYPGGPIIDSLAQQGNPKAVRFPRTLLGASSLDFSFSGLKTSVLYHVHGVPGRKRPRGGVKSDAQSAIRNPQSAIHDVAASFQSACIDILVEKLRRGARQIAARSILIGGGVSANRGLRQALASFNLPVFFPPPQYCTDNAAMSAALAHLLLTQGQTSPLNLDAIPHSQFRP